VRQFARDHKLVTPEIEALARGGAASAMAAFVGHGKVVDHWQCIGGKHELFAYLEETTSIPIM
jgi:hypothetical protein